MVLEIVVAPRLVSSENQFIEIDCSYYAIPVVFSFSFLFLKEAKTK